MLISGGAPQEISWNTEYTEYFIVICAFKTDNNCTLSTLLSLCSLDEVNCQAHSIFIYNILIKHIKRKSKLLSNKWTGSKIRHASFYVTNVYSYQYVLGLLSWLTFLQQYEIMNMHPLSIKSMIKNEMIQEKTSTS